MSQNFSESRKQFELSTTLPRWIIVLWQNIRVHLSDLKIIRVTAGKTSSVKCQNDIEAYLESLLNAK
ncbi:MAG: hypothetical protein RR060_00585, partial [Victivallaceae bacterium]